MLLGCPSRRLIRNTTVEKTWATMRGHCGWGLRVRRTLASLARSLAANSSDAAKTAKQRGEPAWLEIDLQALSTNLAVIKQHIAPGAEICGVIKGNAYGHGAAALAHEILRLGATRLAVATVDEGAEVRHSLTQTLKWCKIHLLGPAHPLELRAARDVQLIPTICTIESAAEWARLDKEDGHQEPVFVKVDTGMHRAGVHTHELQGFLSEIEGDHGLHVEGIMTHFARADNDPGFTEQQLGKFNAATVAFGDKYVLSCANSAGLLGQPGSSAFQKCMVRPGMALYGLPPSEEFAKAGLSPLMRLRARPNMLKDVKKGSSIGYGDSYISSEDIRIAVLPIGYADGLDRGLSNRGFVRYEHEDGEYEYCPIVGRISMDETTIRVDMLREPAAVNLGSIFDVVTPDLDSRTSLTGWATILGTINYEVATGISHRLPRIYLSENKPL